MKEIRVSERAQEDLIDIWEFLTEDHPESAKRIMKTFRDKFEMLLKHPLMGRERNEIFIGLSSFPANRYMIFYQPMDYGIEILRVRHGAADLSGIFEL